MYVFKETGLAWLKERGYEWVKVRCLYYVLAVRTDLHSSKVNAAPGDLIIWDSRTPHYNKSPMSNTSRFAVYTCYLPASAATQEELIRKKDLFERQKGHSHWPMALQPHIEELIAPMRDGKPDPLNTWAPRKPPQLSARAYKVGGDSKTPKTISTDQIYSSRAQHILLRLHERLSSRRMRFSVIIEYR